MDIEAKSIKVCYIEMVQFCIEFSLSTITEINTDITVPDCIRQNVIKTVLTEVALETD